MIAYEKWLESESQYQDAYQQRLEAEQELLSDPDELVDAIDGDCDDVLRSLVRAIECKAMVGETEYERRERAYSVARKLIQRQIDLHAELRVRAMP